METFMNFSFYLLKMLDVKYNIIFYFYLMENITYQTILIMYET